MSRRQPLWYYVRATRTCVPFDSRRHLRSQGGKTPTEAIQKAIAYDMAMLDQYIAKVESYRTTIAAAESAMMKVAGSTNNVRALAPII